MKKTVFIFLSIFFIINGFVHTQDNTTILMNLTSELIDMSIDLLGKPVPDKFQRVSRTMFVLKSSDTSGIGVTVDDGLVNVSAVTIMGNINFVREFNVTFYNYFENNSWRFLRESGGADIYVKNGIFAAVTQPFNRDDGLMGATIMFSSNLNNF
jgi:hypothetical protein